MEVIGSMEEQSRSMYPFERPKVVQPCGSI